MLKWAVHNPRHSYLPEAPQSAKASTSYNEFHAAIPNVSPVAQQRRAKLKRKSSASTLYWRQAGGKENQLTSTPLPATVTSSSSSSSLLAAARQTQSLKDLSNILLLPQTPIKPNKTPQLPAHYASTLPTFEAEYSPCGLIPGPLLALRGVGIPDSYFEKPRYLAGLTEDTSTYDSLEQKPLAKCLDNLLPAPTPQPIPIPTPTVTVTQPATLKPDLVVDANADLGMGARTNTAEQSVLSSTKMGDVTLERMIDAILASTCKQPRRRHIHRHHPHPHSHEFEQLQQLPRKSHFGSEQKITSETLTSPSPTYRPAYDPASDLSEYWRSGAVCDFEPYPSVGYQEREVRSPLRVKRLVLYQQQLRRQRVVRRKRKIATKISSSVKHSAQKLLATGRERISRSAQKSQPQEQEQPQALASQNEQAMGRDRLLFRHASPDSGHNSTSDYDEYEDYRLVRSADQSKNVTMKYNEFWHEKRAMVGLPRCTGGIEPELCSLVATKRRLSFSQQNLNT